MQVIVAVLGLCLWSYLGVLTLRAALSWLPLLIRDWRPAGVIAVISGIVDALTDPPLAFLGRFFPVLRAGKVGLDLGFLVLYVVVLGLARVLW
jgi:YggT family protein